MSKEHQKQDDRWQGRIGLDSVHGADTRRRVFSFLAMAVVAIVVFAGLVVTNYQTYPRLLSYTLIGTMIGILIAVAIYFKSRRLDLPINIVAIVVLLLNFLLIYTGGKESTALYWLMFSPLVIFAILGVKRGSALIGIMVIGFIVLLFGDDYGQAQYREIEKSRFLASYSVVLLFAFINEYFHGQSLETISGITLEQKKKANTDPLTGLPNRRFIDAYILTQIKQEPEQFFPMSLVMADIDFFKRVNDNYGHDVGDEALIFITQLFKRHVRYSDIVARYGGEEFLICLPHAELNVAQNIAEKMRAALEVSQLNVGDKRLSFTCSFGVSQLSAIDDFDACVKQADENLYKAKHSGRNKVVVSELQ